MATIIRLYRRPVGGTVDQVALVDQITDADNGDFSGSFKLDGTGAGVAVPAGTYDFSLTAQTDGYVVSDHTAVVTRTVAVASTWPMVNNGFESALAAPWSTSGGASGSAAFFSGRYLSTSMTGSYVGRIYAQSYSDGLEIFDSANAALSYVWTKDEIDASGGALTFDARMLSTGSEGAKLTFLPYDASNSYIGKPVNGETNDQSWVYKLTTTASHGENSSLILPVVNTTYTRSVNVKTAAEATLLAGKTWADVAKVEMRFSTWEPSDNTYVTDVFVDNFR